MGTSGAWATDFAKALGNTNPSASTINWISAWTVGEGTKAKYNPLATTYDLPPNTCFNSVCVRNFETRDQGIQATVKTLMGNHQGYEDIREGIRTNDPQRAANGLKAAPWGTNGGLVENTWRMYDVRDHILLSEPETEGSAERATASGNPKPEPNAPANPFRPETSKPNPLGPEGSGPSTPELPSFLGDETSLGLSKRIIYIAGGCILVGLGVVLAVKSYIPTQQIVKTVAAVA